MLTDDRPLGCTVGKRGGMILVTKKAVSYQERRTFLENRARLTKNVLYSFEKRHAGLGHAGLRKFVGMEYTITWLRYWGSGLEGSERGWTIWRRSDVMFLFYFTPAEA